MNPTIQALVKQVIELVSEEQPPKISPTRHNQHHINFELGELATSMGRAPWSKQSRTSNVTDLLEKQMRRKSKSPWTVLSLMPKKDKSRWLCIDSSSFINCIAVRSQKSIYSPSLDAIFSKINWQSGYHQIHSQLVDER